MNNYRFILQTVQGLSVSERRSFNEWMQLCFGTTEVSGAMTETDLQEIYDYLKILKNRS